MMISEEADEIHLDFPITFAHPLFPALTQREHPTDDFDPDELGLDPFSVHSKFHVPVSNHIIHRTPLPSSPLSLTPRFVLRVLPIFAGPSMPMALYTPRSRDPMTFSNPHFMSSIQAQFEFPEPDGRPLSEFHGTGIPTGQKMSVRVSLDIKIMPVSLPKTFKTIQVSLCARQPSVDIDFARRWQLIPIPVWLLPPAFSITAVDFHSISERTMKFAFHEMILDLDFVDINFSCFQPKFS
jgi:hypothetical protein